MDKSKIVFAIIIVTFLTFTSISFTSRDASAEASYKDEIASVEEKISEISGAANFDFDNIKLSGLEVEGDFIEDVKRKFVNFKDYLSDYIEQLKRDFRDIKGKTEKLLKELQKNKK